MPRKQGVGMRRPKKSKPAVVDEVLIEPLVVGADDADDNTACDAHIPDAQVIESDEDDTPYEPTQEDWAEIEYQVACHAFVMYEKHYQKAEAAYQLAKRMCDVKRKRILARQERALASKQRRYEKIRCLNWNSRQTVHS